MDSHPPTAILFKVIHQICRREIHLEHLTFSTIHICRKTTSLKGLLEIFYNIVVAINFERIFFGFNSPHHILCGEKPTLMWKLDKFTLLCYSSSMQLFITIFKVIQAVTLWTDNIFYEPVFVHSKLFTKQMNRLGYQHSKTCYHRENGPKAVKCGPQKSKQYVKCIV